MALNASPRNRGLLLLHLLVRFAGLTGLLAMLVGVLVVLIGGSLPPLTFREWFSSTGLQTFLGPADDPVHRWAALAALIGAGFVVLALLVESIVVLRMVAVRRSAFAFNAGAQMVLALVLLVGVNWYSSQHYFRLDWTQDREFTLPKDVQADLRQLKGTQGETTIVVYKQHKTFGRLTDKPDALDYAAERKVVEKIEDLVQQLGEFGRQFKVVVLDVEDEGFEDQRDQLTRNAKALREAIDRSVENSIFFYSKDTGRVQSLSFNDFYALDKTASQETNNLVLLKQGERAFTNKVLNIDEKRPKIGILTIHEWLTTEGPEEFGMAGLKKALTARGFDVQDVVLKKWSETGPPEPAVYTYDESKNERLEEQLTELEADVKLWEGRAKSVEEIVQLWKTASLAELTKKYARDLGGRQVTQRMRELQLEAFEQRLTLARFELKLAREERDTVAREKSGLNVEGLAEQRRMTDLKAKLSRMLADFDLVVIPRMTLRNVTIGDRIPTRVYRLDDAQVAAVREYLKSGKPVLACFGPTNEPAERFEPGPTGPDGVEDLLTQLGIRLGKQTVLFNAESKSFAERRSGLLTSGANVEVPPVDFEWRAGAGELLPRDDRAEREPHPIRESMRIVARSAGRETDKRGDKEATDVAEDKVPPDRRLDLRLRHPRPIWFDPEKAKQLGYDPVFMMTSPSSWNDDNPFPTRERTPRLELKPDDPNKGTPDEKREGPFPIGVAVETDVPAGWYEGKNATPAKVRLAVVGHGGLFVQSELSPVREKLLLNTVNWLLGRDDLLPRAKDEQRWQYPRVALSSRDRNLWRSGAQWLLPGLFAYVGVAVLLVRRMR